MRPPVKKPRRHGGGSSNGTAATAAASGGTEVRRALAWLNSYPKVSRWMEQYDIVDLVNRGGGICRVENFLPPFVAEGALRIMERLPPGRWRATEAGEDYTHNNIAHAFWSIKGNTGGADETLEALLRAFTLLLPDQLNAFSAARYDRGHHIAPHDDRAYTSVRMDTGEVVTCSRDLTCVYYLTKDWEESMGGALLDLEAPPEGEKEEEDADAEAPAQEEGPPLAEGRAKQQGQHQGRGQGPIGVALGSAGSAGGGAQRAAQRPQQRSRGRAYVPLFNSAVFFRVPRYHSVTPLTTDRPRYSVFGWFLQPGKLYDLYTGEEEEETWAGGKEEGADKAEQRRAAKVLRQQQQQQLRAQLRAQLPAPQDPAGAEEPVTEEQQEEPDEQHAAGLSRVHKKRKKRRPGGAGEQQQEAAGEEEGGGAAALHCKLAQRLLAKLAGQERRRQQRGSHG